jgi:hypothetical protein
LIQIKRPINPKIASLRASLVFVLSAAGQSGAISRGYRARAPELAWSCKRRSRRPHRRRRRSARTPGVEPVVQDSHEKKKSDFNPGCGCAAPGRGAGEVPQPGGRHHPKNERHQRRNVAKRPHPSARHRMDPQEHQLGGLRIGEYVVDNPGVSKPEGIASRKKRMPRTSQLDLNQWT